MAAGMQEAPHVSCDTVDNLLKQVNNSQVTTNKNAYDTHLLCMLQYGCCISPTSVVGPPGLLAIWIGIWNQRVRGFTSQQTAFKSWSVGGHWNLAQYFATLPGHRWIKKVVGMDGNRGVDALVL